MGLMEENSNLPSSLLLMSSLRGSSVSAAIFSGRQFEKAIEAKSNVTFRCQERTIFRSLELFHSILQKDPPPRLQYFSPDEPCCSKSLR
ncbi:hypothetical protein CEXT_324041 [Caerostris extrusa]|uniref:Uncharacterized protein n=1 Tax=Caerostris extrusa TaxID=172846 RepID=A0AAV4R5S4_CAEEX|nr:hypothetical protein CEXT_324041 [Caerostris extrusa]